MGAVELGGARGCRVAGAGKQRFRLGEALGGGHKVVASGGDRSQVTDELALVGAVADDPKLGDRAVVALLGFRQMSGLLM